MNKEQEELLDAAYENYSKEYEKDNSIGMCLLVKRLDGKSTYRKPNKEMFVDLCTYDKTFSEKWGLKIEERELNVDELNIINLLKQTSTKLITITYNDKTIESYE
jgi:hypothetical protein